MGLVTVPHVTAGSTGLDLALRPYGAVGHLEDGAVGGQRRRASDPLPGTADEATRAALVAELERSGQLTPEAAEHHPQRSIITRALGPEPDVEVDTHTHPARDGDVYLLCSDGLTGMVSDGEVATILRGAPTLEAAAEALIRAANQSGGRDNITVVLAQTFIDPLWVPAHGYPQPTPY